MKVFGTYSNIGTKLLLIYECLSIQPVMALAKIWQQPLHISQQPRRNHPPKWKMGNNMRHVHLRRIEWMSSWMSWDNEVSWNLKHTKDKITVQKSWQKYQTCHKLITGHLFSFHFFFSLNYLLYTYITFNSTTPCNWCLFKIFYGIIGFTIQSYLVSLRVDRCDQSVHHLEERKSL